MKKTTRQHRHVHYLCDKMKATSLGGNQVDIFPYQSNILRADLRTSNYAYDSINCKKNEKDPLSNEGYFQLLSQYLRKGTTKYFRFFLGCGHCYFRDNFRTKIIAEKLRFKTQSFNNKIN